MKRSREFELEADRDAATMLMRAGYKGRVCQQELEFMHRSIGDGSITEPESTHPGYEQRIKMMQAHYDTMEKQRTKIQPHTLASYNYDRSDNLFTLTPRKKQ
jgi:predicted Zn-dependent protease